jgi:hypothetical protein
VINLVGVVGVAPTSTRLKVDETDYYATLEHEVGFEPTLDRSIRTAFILLVRQLSPFDDKRINLTHGQLLDAAYSPHESEHLASTTAVSTVGIEPTGHWSYFIPIVHHCTSYSFGKPRSPIYSSARGNSANADQDVLMTRLPVEPTTSSHIIQTI